MTRSRRRRRKSLRSGTRARVSIGFNVSYVQDVLGVLTTDTVRLSVSDANSSALVGGPGADDSVYVVMPMRLWLGPA